MSALSDERRAVERRMNDLAIELRAMRRVAALEGADMTDRWDELMGERLLLARRMLALHDEHGLTSTRSLLLLSAAIAMLAVAVNQFYRGDAGHWAAAWFIVGLLNGAYLIATRRRRGATWFAPWRWFGRRAAESALAQFLFDESAC